MADFLTKQKRSLLMASIKSKANKDTELLLMAILREHRFYGWRRNHPLPGRPDFVFKKFRVAVFVDGCFWHCCPVHGRFPKSNVKFWSKKLERNKARDRKVTRMLKSKGWKVVRIWEHSLIDPNRVISRLKRACR